MLGRSALTRRTFAEFENELTRLLLARDRGRAGEMAREREELAPVLEASEVLAADTADARTGVAVGVGLGAAYGAAADGSSAAHDADAHRDACDRMSDTSFEELDAEDWDDDEAAFAVSQSAREALEDYC